MTSNADLGNWPRLDWRVNAEATAQRRLLLAAIYAGVPPKEQSWSTHMPTLRTPAGPIEFEPMPYTVPGTAAVPMFTNTSLPVVSPASDPIAELGRAVEAWRGVARQRADEVIELQRVVAFQDAIMEAQGKNIAERDHVIEMQEEALRGLGIQNDRAVARVAELEALLQAADDKPAPTPPTPAADSAPAAKNPEAFDRSRQDKAVGRWASR